MLRFLLLLSTLLLVTEATSRCGGPDSHSCHTRMAKCVRGVCQCNNPFTWGDPSFACYEEDDLGAEIKNDPAVRTFGKEWFPFPYPCRYLVTHFKREIKDTGDNVIGHCTFKIHAYNAKYRGKFYPLGFDVATRVKYVSGRKVETSSRVFGNAKNDKYQFRIRGTRGQYIPDGPWKRQRVSFQDGLTGLKLSLKVDRVNNQAIYEVDKCGLRLTFVPYDVKARRNQTSVPGIAVTLKHANHVQSVPEFKSSEKALLLAPVIAGGHRLEDLRNKGLDVEQSMLYRAFASNVLQNQPYTDRGQCEISGKTLRKCSREKRSRAMHHCEWILTEPKFVYCIDRTTGANAILRLFNRCVEVHCDDRPCDDVTKIILRKECDKFGDSADKFVKSGRCRLS